MVKENLFIDLLQKQDEKLRKIESLIISTKAVLNFDEAVKFTGLSKSYLYKLTSRGEIPHYKPNGKVIYFETSQIQKWLLRNPVKTSQELDKEAASYCTLKKGGAE